MSEVLIAMDSGIMSIEDMANGYMEAKRKLEEAGKQIKEYECVVKEKEDYIERLERQNIDLKRVRDELRKEAEKKKPVKVRDLMEYLRGMGVTAVKIEL